MCGSFPRDLKAPKEGLKRLVGIAPKGGPLAPPKIPGMKKSPL